MEANTAQVIPSRPAIEFITTVERALSAFSALRPAAILYLDIETFGWIKDSPHSGQIRLITLYDGVTVYVFDWLRVSSLKDEFKGLLRSRGIVGHNLKFDFYHIKKELGIIPQILYDTMVGSLIIGSPRQNTSHSLQSCLLRFCGVDIDKSEQQSDWSGELSQEQIAYAANDVIFLPELLAVQIERLNKYASYRRPNQALLAICKDIHSVFKLNHLAALVELSFLPAVVAMEYNGLKIDVEMVNQLLTESQSEQQKAFVEFKQICPTLNPTQDRALAKKFVQDGINLPFTDKGNHRLDKHVLIPLAASNTLAEILLRFRYHHSKVNLCQNLMEAMDQTHRVHSHFKCLGPNITRMSSSDPNIQNIPKAKQWRNCVVPEQDRVFVVGDFPQIEMRIISVYMKDTKLFEFFKARKDIYVEYIKNRLGEDHYNALSDTEKKDVRQKAKAIALGLSFAMGAESLVEYAHDVFNLNLSLDEANRDRTAFLTQFSGIESYINSWETKKGPYGSAPVYTFLGRRLLAHSKHKWANYPVQSSAAELLKLTILILRKKVLQQKIPVVLANLAHDEIVNECNREYAVLVSRLMQESMVAAASYLNIPLAMEDVDVKIVDRWGDAK